MEYNPFTAQVRQQCLIIDALQTEASEYRERIAWYDNFDPQAAIHHAEADLARILREETELLTVISEARNRMTRARVFTWLRLYPPALLNRQVRESGAEFKSSKAVVAAGLLRAPELRAEGECADEALVHQRAEAERHLSINRQVAFDRLRALEADIEARTPDLESLKNRATYLEEKLAEPVRALRTAQAERRDVKQKTALARGYLEDLENAPDSRARAKIHRSAESSIGDDKPSRFIASTKGKLDQLERQILKLEERVRTIVRQGTMDVRSLILDGSNLCHSGTERIGLFALRALNPYLLEGREVQAVFDASVVQLLGVSVERLKTELSPLPVHVAGDKSDADKVILRLADEPGTYVLSNDRFADYPDMAAVVADRIIGVEIIGGRRAIIDDLDIDIEFSREH